MDDLYPHSCTIMRSKGATDDNGDEVFDILYTGNCDLQYGGSGNTGYKGSTIQSSPVVFIPVNNIKFRINDRVDVVTGGSDVRVQTFTVEQWDAISDEDLLDLKDTELWLKAGVDV